MCVQIVMVYVLYCCKNGKRWQRVTKILTEIRQVPVILLELCFSEIASVNAFLIEYIQSNLINSNQIIMQFLDLLQYLSMNLNIARICLLKLLCVCKHRLTDGDVANVLKKLV